MKCTVRFFSVLLLQLFIVVSVFSQSPKYEFRAAWVATVDNIDWPVKGSGTEAQKKSFTDILDLHKSNGLNAVVVQIRPAADAFFPSQYEPWSEFLTGTQGKPPSPYYDPLEFMITETHKRGMEFHGWINPYRARFTAGSSIAPSHVTKTHPEWFVSYGVQKYFNPGLPEVRKHVNRVIQDIVERYDIDAIHIDDYFYPYRIEGKEFGDYEAYKQYGNGMKRDDWRRQNIDSIIYMLSNTIKQTNPRVKFGISPFGIWRNKKEDIKGSNTNGSSSYDENKADILKWLDNEWIDYVAPQLYWQIGHRLADYKTLLDWWSDNVQTAHLFIGQAPYRIGETGWKNKNEIARQIKMIRDKENVFGSIFFTTNTFKKNPWGLNDTLRNNYYKTPALVPPMWWIDSVAPAKPVVIKNTIQFQNGDLQFKISNNNNDVRNYVIYLSDENEIDLDDSKYIFKIIPAAEINAIKLKLPDVTKTKKRFLKITAVDVNNNESEPEEFMLMQ